MSYRHGFMSCLRFAGRQRGLLTALLFGLILSGCSSSLTRVQTWEGESVRDSELALLKVPASVRVTEVNGREMSRFLMDDMAIDYQLLAGNATVVFSYRTIWARPSGARSGEPRVDVVEATPQVIHFEAKAGEVYHFELPEASSRREAEALAAGFRASLVTGDGLRVADSEPYEGGYAGYANANGDRVRPGTVSEPLTTAPEGELTEADEDASPVVRQLQQLWGEASEQERRYFLRWAFD